METQAQSHDKAQAFQVVPIRWAENEGHVRDGGGRGGGGT